MALKILIHGKNIWSCLKQTMKNRWAQHATYIFTVRQQTAAEQLLVLFKNWFERLRHMLGSAIFRYLVLNPVYTPKNTQKNLSMNYS